MQLRHFLIGPVIIFAVIGGWMLIQKWSRRDAPRAEVDCDLLEGRVGCHACDAQETCELHGSDAD